MFEDELIRQQAGPVTPWQAKQLRTASKCLGAAMRIDRILKAAGEPGMVGVIAKTDGNVKATSQTGLTHEQYMGYLDRAVRYEAECDRALRSIGLDKSKEEDPWAAIYAMPAETLPFPPTTQNKTASDPPASEIGVPGANGALSSEVAATFPAQGIDPGAQVP
jgi:hypothetical protein